MSKFPNVRIAMPSDRPEILRLCRELHGENGLFPLDEDNLRGILDKAFLPSGGLQEVTLGVVGDPGNLKGCICVAVQNFWYTKEFCVNELWNYVHPEHRQSDYAVQLMEFARSFADTWELPLVIGVLSNERTEAKMRLYSRYFRMRGAYFVYDPKDKEGSEPKPIKSKEDPDRDKEARKLAAMLRVKTNGMALPQIIEGFERMASNEARKLTTILMRRSSSAN